MYNTKCRRMVYITINTAKKKMWMGFCYMVCYVHKIKGEEVKTVLEDQN